MVHEVNIFQNIYTDPIPDRDAELRECEKRNQSLVSRFSTDINYLKVLHRPTFNEMFKYTQNYERDDINIIANSDIIIPMETIEQLRELYHYHKNRNRLCLALSRWDIQEDGSLTPFLRADSQDTWIFYGHVQTIEGADFYAGGVAGCDNRIAYLLALEGYQVINPCLTIQTHHLHLSGVRNYIRDGVVTEKVPPPYKMVAPCSITIDP